MCGWMIGVVVEWLFITNHRCYHMTVGVITGVVTCLTIDMLGRLYGT